MELTIQNLTKQYKDKIAVSNVNISLTPGVWGLLGANGAGKTTLMRMITGILSPTSGAVLWDGVDITTLGEGYRDVLGYLPQTFGYYPEFTVQDYLMYVATLKGLTRQRSKTKIDEMLHALSLVDVRKKHIRKLSGGMQRRVGIAQAMLNDPEILILDEPTSGLDPGERIRFRNLIAEFAQSRIVLISTHIVSDIEYIALQNAVMKAGQIIGVGTTDELIQAVQGKVYTTNITEAELPQYEKMTRIVNIRSVGYGALSVRYVSDTMDIPDSSPIEPRLEDLYLWLFREEAAQKEGHTCN